MPNLSPLAAAALFALAMGLGTPASAANNTTTAAVDSCNGALPGYEGALRKRALAIANEGTVNAFLSCGIQVNEFATRGNSLVAVFAINRTTTTQALTCTFVDGLPPEYNAISSAIPAALYRVKSAGILPGAVGIVQWAPAEFDVPRFSKYASVSCSLPPGVEINMVGAAWEANTP